KERDLAARRVNLRLCLILSHRWMGIAIGLMFVVWTVSGLVLMYYGLPHLTAGERLARLPHLDAGAIRISPLEAAALVEGEPFRMRISMLGDRPVYRINTGRVFGRWTDLGLPKPAFTLPVLRVEFDDPLETWLYATPSHG